MNGCIRRVLRAAAALALAALAGCAAVSDRVVLLPQSDGRPSAVVVQAAQGTVVLDQPYAQAQVRGGQVEPLPPTNAAAVAQRYGALLAAQPPRTRLFTVYFASGGGALTPESLPVLQEIRAALADYPAGDLVVVGHTDRVGSLQANDLLSVERANVVRRLLVEAGVPAERIAATGRGEREPLVPTADEVAEPRNRRVEIRLR